MSPRQCLIYLPDSIVWYLEITDLSQNSETKGSKNNLAVAHQKIEQNTDCLKGPSSTLICHGF